MLFDLEDYRWSGFFGRFVNGQYPQLDPIPLEKISPNTWNDAEANARTAAGDLHRSVMRYTEAALSLSTLSERTAILDAEFDIWTKYVAFRKISVDFWNGLKSIPVKGQFNEGDTFNVIPAQLAIDTNQVGFNFEILLWIDQNPQLMTAVLYENGEGYFKYKELTQELYDSYVAALKAWLKAVKDLYALTDNSTFEDWVAPAVPAWNDYPELSGYVRDLEGRIVEGAIVNLIDAQGNSYSTVTNVSGYYKFSKEYIYNNIELANVEEGQLNTFKITVSDVTEAGTSLYSTTNKFQSSFFGAVNDRGVEWPIELKNGKENRKNFRVDFLTDYTSYPSIKGQVLDQDGNPVQNAFVELTYVNGGLPVVGSIQLPDGSWKKRTKYTLFGESKSILTDATGHYEYPSQLVGEWFDSYVKASFEPAYRPILNYNPNQEITGVTLDEQLTGLSEGFTLNGSKITGWAAFKAVKQSDGKIVVSGTFTEYNGTSVGPVVRLNTDGSLDETFTSPYISNNYYYEPNGNFDNQSYIISLSLHTDDKLIISGKFDTVNGVSRNMIARLNADGTIDETFDAGNIFSGAAIDNNGVYYGSPNSNVVKVQPDGKILVGGYFVVPSVNMYGLVRLNSDGSIDNTFVNGLDLPQGVIGGCFEDPHALELQADGKILVGGSQWNGWFLNSLDPSWSTINWNDITTIPTRAIYRLNVDGTLDTTFDAGAYMYKIDNETETYTHLQCITVDENGKILIGGQISKFGNQRVNNIVRLNSNGTLDKVLPSYLASYEVGSAIYSIFANSEKIIAFGKFMSAFEDKTGVEDCGAIITFNSNGTIEQNYELQKSLKFVNDYGVSNISIDCFVDLGDSLMVFGSFDRFDDGKNFPGIQSKTVAKIKLAPMSFYAPHLTEQYASTFGWNLSLNDPAPDGDYRFTQNDFKVTLNPYIQDPVSGDVIETGDSSLLIYNYQDWFNSRFAFAYNERNEVYIKTFIPGENVVNVREYLVDPEHNAEKIYISPRSDGNNYHYVTVKSTTGYVRSKLQNGQYQIHGWGDPNSNFSVYVAIDGDMNSDKTFYIYSSDENGLSSGFITDLTIQESLTQFDISRAHHLETLVVLYTESERIDLTGATGLINLFIVGCYNIKEIEGIETLPNLINVQLDVSGTNVTKSTTEIEYVFDDDMFDGVTPIRAKLGFNGPILEMKKLRNGKFVVGGQFDSYLNSYSSYANGYKSVNRFAILNPDLSLDSNYYYNNIGAGFNGAVRKIVEQADGKIIVSGDFDTYFHPQKGNHTCYRIARLNSDGSFDNSFSSQIDGNITHIEVDEFNRITVSGYDLFSNGENKGGLCRLNSNGTIDSQFNIAIPNLGVKKFKYIGNGKLLICSSNGYYNNNFVNQLFIINSDGSLDYEFYNNYTNQFVIGYIHLNNFEVHEGKILIATEYGYFNNWQSVPPLLKLNSDGTLDSSFNNNLMTSNQGAKGLHIREDGSIVLFGDFNVYGNNYNIGRAIILNSDGTLNYKFIDFCNQSLYGVIEESNSFIFFGNFSQGGAAEVKNIAKFNLEGKEIYHLNLPKVKYSLTLDCLNNKVSAYEIDQLAIQLDNDGELNGYLYLNGINYKRGIDYQFTPEVEQARANLISKGWSINEN